LGTPSFIETSRAGGVLNPMWPCPRRMARGGVPGGEPPLIPAPKVGTPPGPPPMAVLPCWAGTGRGRVPLA